MSFVTDTGTQNPAHSAEDVRRKLASMSQFTQKNNEELDRVLEILWLATDAAEDGRPVYGEGLLRYMLNRAEGLARSGESQAPGVVNAYRQSLAFYLTRYSSGD